MIDARRQTRRLIPVALLTLLSTLTTLAAHAESVLPVETWQTDNGAKVLFYATDSLPIVDAQLIFDAGSARDPK
ncbi:MAG TPA: insulinase family protein, partial [Halothiobacillaceae bacterium]|nr:insulinase family protein [Halothiobacillaceae bacterium]